MSLTVAEAERSIIAEWRTWSTHHDSYTVSEMLIFFSHLQKSGSALLSFRHSGPDKWQPVKGWLQNYEARRAKMNRGNR